MYMTVWMNELKNLGRGRGGGRLSARPAISRWLHQMGESGGSTGGGLGGGGHMKIHTPSFFSRMPRYTSHGAPKWWKPCRKETCGAGGGGTRPREGSERRLVAGGGAL